MLFSVKTSKVRRSVNSLNSTSELRRLWYVALFVLSLYSTIVIPYKLSFLFQPESFDVALQIAMTLCFWVEIILNFNTPYQMDGIVVTDPAAMRRHYLLTWFPVDFMTNFPWEIPALIILGPLFHGFSTFYLFSILQLFRVLRIPHYVMVWKKSLTFRVGTLQLFKLLTFWLITIHLIACGWFMVDDITGFPPNSWVVKAGLLEGEPWNQYLHSLYWTLVTIASIGYGDITPGTTPEMIFAIVVMVIALSFAALVIGTVASLITSISRSEAIFREHEEMIDQYMVHNEVPIDLRLKVQDYFDYIWSRHRGLDLVKYMAELSHPLQMEISLNFGKKMLTHIPLFEKASDKLLQNIFFDLSFEAYAPGDMIAHEGEDSEEIFMINSGEIEIITLNDGVLHGTLKRGDYFGYLPILFKEKFSASLRAVSYCDIFVLKKAKFEQLLSDHPELKRAMNEASKGKISQVSDLIEKGVII